MSDVLPFYFLFFTFVGGQGGIRTHEAVTPTRVPVVLLQPLGHLSKTTVVSV